MKKSMMMIRRIPMMMKSFEVTSMAPKKGKTKK
jgi:hypothetical protein